MGLVFRWHHKKPLIASRSLSGFLIYIPTTKCRTIKYSEYYSNKATYSAHYTRIYKWTITVKCICKGGIALQDYNGTIFHQLFAQLTCSATGGIA